MKLDLVSWSQKGLSLENCGALYKAAIIKDSLGRDDSASTVLLFPKDALRLWSAVARSFCRDGGAPLRSTDFR